MGDTKGLSRAKQGNHYSDDRMVDCRLQSRSVIHSNSAQHLKMAISSNLQNGNYQTRSKLQCSESPGKGTNHKKAEKLLK